MNATGFAYKKVIKPLLFRLSPDTAHAQVVRGLSLASNTPGIPQLVRQLHVRTHPELIQRWKGMTFSSPVGLSAGLDKNGRISPMMQALGFGFAEVGSVTAQLCVGNPKPWFYRLPKSQSLVVHVGLANEGVEPIVGRLESYKQVGFPIVLSIARTNSQAASGIKEGIQDYVASAKRAHRSPAIGMVELNISCPNAYGGQTFTTPKLLTQLLDAIDAVGLSKPVFVKMPIDLSWTQTAALLDVIVKHNITGVTMTNLTKQRSGLVLHDPLPDTVLGGLSGAPIRDLSTELIRKTYAHYGSQLTIIGVGGILSAEDAYEKIKAGATFVELVTGLIMNGPQFVEEVNKGLVRLMRADGYAHISQAVGADVRLKP